MYQRHLPGSKTIKNIQSEAPEKTGSDSTNVDHPWEDDNQAWWDWYLTLADNEPDDNTDRVDLSHDVTATPADDDTVATALAEPYPLSSRQIADFRANGYVKLPDVLSPPLVSRLRLAIGTSLEDRFKVSLDGGVTGRFLSAEMAWLDDPVLRAFTLSPRIAGIAAALIDADAVRLYHDNLLSKEPGSGRTPWHYDDHHFPLATDQVLTAWIPAQPIPRAMGPLAF
ncbi:MAG: phytanoyl-CoA dioxygenase family protein, partial [Pseudomonadota bacterium]